MITNKFRRINFIAIRKYLQYALGEVTLIVLGILLALQVNNWNENRKREAEVLNYLNNLKTAIQRDIDVLDQTISFNSLRLQGVFYLLKHAELDTSVFTEIPWIDWKTNTELHGIWDGKYPDSLNIRFTEISFSLLGRGFGGASFDKSVLNELYSTGLYSYIQNPTLKNQIGNYYRYLNQRLEGYALEEHEEWANEVTRYLRDSYGIFTLDVSDIDHPVKLISGRKDVENHLRYLALEINYHCVWSSKAKDLAISLVEQIEKEQNNYQ